MMSRKHFKRIAEILNKNVFDLKENEDNCNVFNDLVNDFMAYFQEENPLFDRSKFIDAVNKN